jgi:hypothetical protein
MDACPDCNHSGFTYCEGDLVDCRCVAPFQRQVAPLVPIREMRADQPEGPG